MELFNYLSEKYPFITYLRYGGDEYVGIIQNSDETITTIYDYGTLHTDQQKQKFLNLGETWWWESNRIIPINIFLKSDWAEFRFTAKTFASKDVIIVLGPNINLKDIAAKRSKRRSITLIKRVD